MWNCRRALPADWPSLAPLVHQWNQRADGRVRCLHAEQGATPEQQAESMRGLAADKAVFIVASRRSNDAAIGGLAGATFDAAAGRAWVWGPLVDEQDDADALRATLIDALRRALPQISRFDSFPQADEASLLRALEAAGFLHLQHHRVMALEASDCPPASAVPIIDAGKTHPLLGELPELHDRLFPQTYLPGAALAASVDDAHRLLVAIAGGRLAGYVYVQHQQVEGEGYVDYLGVAESARGQGLGGALLTAAARWALIERALPRLHLTVRQDKPVALRLYEGAGFREVAAGAHWMWQRAPA
ncbi:GNAT family N-acetyltransferase [Piscinibacter sakaiensis]|uniref:GNAT family N-acetyltransferase n=1 Tax=Piscinibacter sakaiensis TaxID=1547922 RepID=UPI003AB0A939